MLAAILLWGGVLGLDYVDTTMWGGLMLDFIVAFVTVSGSLPLGILLALGRRSRLPIVRTLSIGYIELIYAMQNNIPYGSVKNSSATRNVFSGLAAHLSTAP